MSALTVNLRLFYQRRGLWFWYFLIVTAGFGLTAEAWADPRAGKGLFTGWLIISLIVGMIVAGLYKDVLSKPFAFCLPGHRRTGGAIVWGAAGVVNLLGGLVFWRYPDLSEKYRCLVYFSGVGAGLICYGLGMWFTFRFVNHAALVGFLPLVIIGMTLLDLQIAIERVIVEYPLFPILAGGVVWAVGWRRLGRRTLSRTNCNAVTMGLGDVFNPKRMKKYSQLHCERQLRRSRAEGGQWLEAFFLRRMEAGCALSSGRYLWGVLYITFWNLNRGWGALATIFIMSLGLSYLPVRNYIVFMMFLFPTMGVTFATDSNLLLPGGRREQYFSTLLVVGVVTVLIVFLLGMLTTLTILLQPYMPDIPIKDESFKFLALDFRYIAVPLIVIPAIISLSIYTRNNHFLVMLMPIGLMMFLIIRPQWLVRRLEPAPIVLTIIALWAVFVLVARYHYQRRWLGQSLRT